MIVEYLVVGVMVSCACQMWLNYTNHEITLIGFVFDIILWPIITLGALLFGLWFLFGFTVFLWGYKRGTRR